MNPRSKFLLIGLCSRRTISVTWLMRRSLFSKTGVWPHGRQLTIVTKKEAEAYWKKKFVDVENTYASDSRKEKKYVLAMFPYPSGKLHMGHVRVYTISDSLARFYHMRGFKVIHPMGWDSFGLPAENAAIENNVIPDEWTITNISQMKAQLLDLGCKFNWDLEFATSDPLYYRWTQHLFLLLYHAGLAYQQEAKVNWDPVDQTVLAHEQVDENGYSWRSGAKVEKKYLKQWFIKTTRFSESLWDGLSNPLLEFWQDIPKVQKHWIGVCDGYRVEMPVVHNDNCEDSGALHIDKLHLWMTQPELLYGVSFIGIQSNHKLNKDAYMGPKFDNYQKLKIQAVCPISKKLIPIVVCDDLPYSEALDYYIGIPCLNENDQMVADTCGFDVMNVVENDTMINSGRLNGLNVNLAREEVAKELLNLNAGGYKTSAKLHDWLISRQRYWGTPIPIIHCPFCGTVPVPMDQLPVTLPKMTKFHEKGLSPLKEDKDWRTCRCPKCGGSAERETDTMDTFADSSWYFLRFLDSQNSEKPFDFDKQAAGMPVDVYVGGKEHAELHMYYARFIQHFLASQGLVSHQEPFSRLVVQGMVMGQSFKVKGTGQYLRKEEVDFSVEPPVELGTAAPVEISYEKMSKSKHNGIDPQEVLDEYGTDTTRLLMLANYAPFTQRNWSKETFPGILSWQNRMWLTITEFIQERQKEEKDPSLDISDIKKHEEYLWDNRNYAVSRTTFCMQETHQLSTAISRMQGLTTSLRKVPSYMMLTEEFELGLAAQIIMLSPITPHLSSELWAGFCSVASSPLIRKDIPLLDQRWPEVDMDYKLPLICVVAFMKMTIKVPRKILDHLTDSSVDELLRNNCQLQESIEGFEIVSTKMLNIKPGISATVLVKTVSKGTIEEFKELRKKNKKKKRSKKPKKNLEVNA